MKKNVILSIFLIATELLLAQPGKPKGPGGQYSERFEMMMIWKLTDHLELSEGQAEKFFPVMRVHQKELIEIRREEKELFLEWTLLGTTVLHEDEWLEVFKETGYTGDYFFTSAKSLVAKPIFELETERFSILTLLVSPIATPLSPQDSIIT